MPSFKFLLPAACVATSLLIGGGVASADTPASGTSAPAYHRLHGHHGGFHAVLSKLNLTADQKTQIKSIFAQSRTQYRSLHEGMKANHQALASADPNDANYPQLLATEKQNAAARVQAMSDIKAQIYAVLTPEQRAQIPALLEAQRAERATKVAAWRSAHGGPAAQ